MPCPTNQCNDTPTWDTWDTWNAHVVAPTHVVYMALSLAPATSLAHCVDAAHALRAPRLRRCAVVFNAGSLLLAQHGTEIDAHDEVCPARPYASISDTACTEIHAMAYY